MADFLNAMVRCGLVGAAQVLLVLALVRPWRRDVVTMWRRSDAEKRCEMVMLAVAFCPMLTMAEFTVLVLVTIAR